MVQALVLKKNLKKFLYATLLTLGLILGSFLFLTLKLDSFFSQKKNRAEIRSLKNNFLKSSSIQISQRQLPIAKSNLNCPEIQNQFNNPEELSRNSEAQIRLKNIHKKIGSNTFRLRQFYKDGDEGDKQAYLVYKENSDGEAVIIEKKLYSKGGKYQQVELAPGEILYTEEGFTLGENTFLRYINKKLINYYDTDGECRF